MSKNYSELTRAEKRALRARALRAQKKLVDIANGNKVSRQSEWMPLAVDCIKTTNVGTDKKVRKVASVTAIAKAIMDVQNGNTGKVEVTGKR